MKKYYLAIDIGASSGRHMLVYYENERMHTEEVYRFSNGMIERNGMMCWNTENLFFEIKEGLKKCKELGKIPYSMGIDTWGVDYVLLDENDQRIGEAVGYRDNRTAGMDKKVYDLISQEDLYSRTGIQKQIFNTIFQLMAEKTKPGSSFEKAESLLMLPDYFNFLLAGVKRMEYTNATTGQLINTRTKDWDYDLIDLLGYKKSLFKPVSMPGTVVGYFKDEIKKETGFDCKVILPATHDTASAVLAVPMGAEGSIYVSSGTWSLMGIERTEADCTLQSMKANFTNEGGFNHRFRFLKNIMGLWMIQSVKKEFEENFSFAEICSMASKETIGSIVDCNDDIFLAPESMIVAVQEFCRNTNQSIPQTPGEIAAVIYNSLAVCYRDTVCEIEKISGKKYDAVYVVGGGANAEYLNILTAKYTKKTVYAGPTEATAIGNSIVQMISDGIFANIEEARSCVKRSFDVKKYDSLN